MLIWVKVTGIGMFLIENQRDLNSANSSSDVTLISCAMIYILCLLVMCVVFLTAKMDIPYSPIF